MFLEANMTTKERILTAINKVQPLDDYIDEDVIYTQKYGFSATNMVYILLELQNDFNFKITDDFVDAMENCTFAQLESLLEQYSGKAA